MSTTESVINALTDFSKEPMCGDIKLGLFGSYARDEQSALSDIDIVIKGNKPLLLVYDGIEGMIQNYINEKLGLECDVVDYADLELDYEEAKELGIEEFTLKSEVDKEVIWIG